jgi:hypothetical protein
MPFQELVIKAAVLVLFFALVLAALALIEFAVGR